MYAVRFVPASVYLLLFRTVQEKVLHQKEVKIPLGKVLLMEEVIGVCSQKVLPIKEVKSAWEKVLRQKGVNNVFWGKVLDAKEVSDSCAIG